MSTLIENLAPAVPLYSVENLPESDGKPMAETPKHVMLIVEALNALQEFFLFDPFGEYLQPRFQGFRDSV